MSIEFKCPHCKTALKAPDQLAGKSGPCPACNAQVTIPDKKEEQKESE